MTHILSILIFFPAIAGLLGFVVNKESAKVYGVAVASIELLISIWLWIAFDNVEAGMQFKEMISIIPNFGISYNLGVDGISLFIVILTTFMTLIGIISLSVNNMKNMIISLLFLEMTMIGVFLSLDAIIFYVFWELSLVPLLYIIGAWGGPKRIYAAVKFFLYTFTGSLVMLVGILAMAYFYYDATLLKFGKGIWSFDITKWHYLQMPINYQIWLFLAFFIGFAVKVPTFPFHTWLPYAHGQAPTIGSVILAAILLKMGAYGFIRFSIPIFPDASVIMIPFIMIIGIIMVIYTAMIAYSQKDIKQVVAYSSVSHMGIIILGLFAMNVEGVTGSVFLILSHGIISGALFLLVGVIYERTHTKNMSEFGGLALIMPKYATIFGIILMASVGLPLTIGFVGEFLVLLGFFKISVIGTILAGTSIILGSIYMLSLYKKSFFGPLTNKANSVLKDLNGRELTTLIPLVVVVIWLGIYPKPILDPINNSVSELINLVYEKSGTDAKDVIITSKNYKEGL